MDILVHASTTGEPFGQVVVEGMAAAKPVVATNGGGVPEIVPDKVTGLLVPMGDAPAMAAAIIEVLSNPTLAQAMGEAGYNRVREHFTIEITARRVETVYDSLQLRHGNGALLPWLAMFLGLALVLLIPFVMLLFLLQTLF